MEEDSPEEEQAPDRAPSTVVSRVVTFDSSLPVLQESPFSNYLNNLSPIKPAKAPNAAQAFSGLNSSPLVFASPNLKFHPRTDHLKRIEIFETSNEEHSHFVRKRYLPDSSKKSKQLVTLSGIASDSVNEESSDSEDVLRVQSCSSSRIADGFLADLFEVDCANSTHLSGQHGNFLKSASEFHCEGDSTKGSGREDTDVQLVSPKQSNRDAEKLFERDGPTIEDEEYRETEPSLSVICDVAMDDLSVDVNENQVDIGPVSDNKEGCHLGASSSHVQPLYDPIQDSEANEYHGLVASESLRLLDGTHHCEEMQQQCLLLRRCLQFDDTLVDVSSNSLGPLSSDVNNSPDSLTMGELEKVDLSEVSSTYIKTSVSTVKAVITGRDEKKFGMTTNKPSGIGLHLNSIIGVRSIRSRETICKENQGERGLKPAGSGTGNMLDKPTDSPFSVEPHNFSKMQDLYGTPLDKRKLPLRFADAEFAQTNSKRRRKASNISNSDGCKRCSCKKSRCLKLYCDCFAAGLFCTEPCACQGCLNRFEEQDTILAARELIESHNPLAFTPKIVHINKELDASKEEDGIWSTPSSARHKKGCNCKKSMCEKKYCECYQANVGCSDNCRCEGCRNFFGTKEGIMLAFELTSGIFNFSLPLTDFLVARELARGIVDEASFEGMGNVKPAKVETYSRNHLMPSTPSFQFSVNRKRLQRSRHVIECLSPSSSAKSGAASWSREMKSEGSKRSPTLLMITDFTDPDCSEKVDESSPKHDSLGSSSHLAPFLSSPFAVKSSSDSSKAELSSSKAEPSFLSTLFGGGRPRSHFLWQQGSLETPGIVSGVENSCQDDKTGSRVSKNLDNNALGISKDVHLPSKPVIVSSPSRKRVSSPHKQALERRLTSTALRSGGKFILKAVPSFPPLTPCANPRDNISEPDGQ